ncbi:hypothetical protein ACFL1X_10715 [Candidatus Hydrogenedentota bacterium]
MSLTTLSRKTGGEQADAILEFLDLSGPRNIQGQPNANVMTINRPSAGGHYRVLWNRGRPRLTVQRRGFTVFGFVNYLHFKCGYAKTVSSRMWALIVDLTAFCIWAWVISGVYIWAKMYKKKRWGLACLAGGRLVFIVLVVLF